MASLPQYFNQQFFDDGEVAAGYYLYTTASGASFPGGALATFQDDDEAVTNTNPIVLDADGRCEMRLLPQAYTLALYTPGGIPTGSLVKTFDGVGVSVSLIGQDLMAAADAEAARAVIDAVGLEGDESIDGIKTFTSSPVVPDATDDEQAVNKGQLDEAIAAVPTGLPPGFIGMHGSSTPPTGWLECNGALVSRVTYAALFAAIGVTHGAGDGVTTFKLPETRGKFPRGLDNGRGIDTGRVFATDQAGQSNDLEKVECALTNDDFAGIRDIPNDGSWSDFVGSGDEGADPNYSLKFKLYGREVRPPNFATIFIIKT